jgi:hypothetical protein
LRIFGSPDTSDVKSKTSFQVPASFKIEEIPLKPLIASDDVVLNLFLTLS